MMMIIMSSSDTAMAYQIYALKLLYCIAYLFIFSFQCDKNVSHFRYKICNFSSPRSYRNLNSNEMYIFTEHKTLSTS